jgi:glycosyltransferase involved in cell wall biosynthesis
MTRSLSFVVPDLKSPSGGNVYNGRLAEGLAAQGWSVRFTHDVDSLPDGALALVDGLIASAIPQVLVAQGDRLHLVPLMHMPLFTEAEREMLRAAPAIVVTSRWTAARLADLDVHIAPPGVDAVPVNAFEEQGGRLLCVAAVTPAKGHDVLIEALSQVDGEWRCTCVGPLDRDPGFARELSTLDERVVFTGPLAGGELAARYEEADLMVLPSRGETYGMVVTEALARGIPVLATDAGGIPEAMGSAPDGSLPGMLVRTGDPRALASALRRWLGEPALRERLRMAARLRRATLSGWDRTAEIVSNALTEVGAGARVVR